MHHLLYFAQQLVDPGNLPQAPAGNNNLAHILDLLFKIIGALAFLMLIIAGFRMVISSGEPNKVAEIRRQIIYIIVGLVLAASADLIVNLIINKAA